MKSCVFHFFNAETDYVLKRNIKWYSVIHIDSLRFSFIFVTTERNFHKDINILFLS